MKRIFVMLIVVFFMILTSIVSAGPLDKGFKFTGLWQGVDPLDGSEVLRSIVKNDAGTFDIIGSETYFTGCDGGRGKVTATAELEAGILVSNDLILECYDLPVYDPVPMNYIPDRSNDTLTEMTVPPVILHRISK